MATVIFPHTSFSQTDCTEAQDACNMDQEPKIEIYNGMGAMDWVKLNCEKLTPAGDCIMKARREDPYTGRLNSPQSDNSQCPAYKMLFNKGDS